MIIEFSICNYQVFIPLIYPIFIQLQSLIKNIYIKDNNILFENIKYYISYLLSIIFLLIIKYRGNPNNKEYLLSSINKTKEDDSDWINPLNISQKKIKREKKLKSLLFAILLIIFSFISIFFNYEYKDPSIQIGKQSIGVFFEIIDFVILSIFILKSKFYSHHYFSLGIISFTLLILFISFIICHEDEKILFTLWYYFFYSLLYSFYYILGRKYMTLYYDSPYNVMFYIGIITSLILIIYDIIMFAYDKDRSGIIVGFQNNIINISSFFLFILDIICEHLWNLGIWLTIYYLTPCHFIISESISEYIYYTIDSIICIDEGKKLNYSTFNIILYSASYIINIFSSLVFNEIIILNCYNFGDYTKKKIQEREKIDTYITFNKLKQSTDEIGYSENHNNENIEEIKNDLPLSLINLENIIDEEDNFKE